MTFELTNDVNLLNFDSRVNNGSSRNKTILNDSKKPLNCLNVYSNKYGHCIEKHRKLMKKQMKFLLLKS